MAVFGLDLPADITWERICVSEDMLDPRACDNDHPAKWQSSIAVFRFVPRIEQQPYPDKRLVYYKVTCSITSYQLPTDEIEGLIDWNGVRATEFDQIVDQLKTSKPCTGATLQVTVTPPHETQVPLADYPYFLDFQPKQRALYEQATDTREFASRSLEALSVRKGAGAANSLEVLDVDLGYSVGVDAKVGDVGGGVKVSRDGQWGSKRLSQDNYDNVRTTESSREARESTSHTTQISQMHNLLQAYHVGTNRALFFMAPRPHVLEEPTGLILGPRPMDGVQEVFLVVCQPKDQGDPCLSARLETSHLERVDILDYDTDSEQAPIAIDIALPAPTEKDPSKIKVADDDNLSKLENFYDCFDVVQSAADSATAKPGYVIDYIDEILNDVKNGTVTTTLASDQKSVSVTGEARAHACFRNDAGDKARGFLGAQAGFTGSADAWGIVMALSDSVKNERPAWVHYQATVHFKSVEKIVKVGEKWMLLIAGRGLCCCAGEQPPGPPNNRRPLRPEIVAAEDVTDLLRKLPWNKVGPRHPLASDPTTGGPLAESRAASVSRAGLTSKLGPGTLAPAVPEFLTARQANLIADAITEVARRISSRSGARRRQVDVVEGYALWSRLGAIVARRPLHAAKVREVARPNGRLSSTTLRAFAEILGHRAPTKLEIVAMSDADFARAGVAAPEITKLRLELLGFPLVRDQDSRPNEPME